MYAVRAKQDRMNAVTTNLVAINRKPPPRDGSQEKSPMQKIVVTGAKGGTGVSIVEAFRAAGYHVVGVDLKPCGFWEADYQQLDLEDGAGVHDAFAGAAAVVHF